MQTAPATDEPNTVLPELLSKASVCELLDNVTPKHVENLVRSGRMPAPVYLGRSPRWQRRVLLEWIKLGCPIVDTEQFDTWQAMQSTAR